MSNKLGSHIKSVSLKKGLFGKKPTSLEIYANGIILKFKNEDKEYLFEQISSIKSFNYFAPNPVEYNFEIFNISGEKISNLGIPYVHEEGATALLEAHMNFQLKDDFPQQIYNSDFILDNYTSWQQGKLVHKNKKGTKEYSIDQIDEFVCNKGCYFFTLKSSKDTIGLFMHDAPNCLTTIEVGKAIASIVANK